MHRTEQVLRAAQAVCRVRSSLNPRQTRRAALSTLRSCVVVLRCYLSCAHVHCDASVRLPAVACYRSKAAPRDHQPQAAVVRYIPCSAPPTLHGFVCAPCTHALAAAILPCAALRASCPPRRPALHRRLCIRCGQEQPRMPRRTQHLPAYR